MSFPVSPYELAEPPIVRQSGSQNCFATAMPPTPPQPAFRTARLRLRPARRPDLAVLHRLWNNSEVRRFLFDDQPVSRALAAKALDNALSCQPSGYGLWLLFLRESKLLIGCAGLLPAIEASRRAPELAGTLEILVALAPRWWHRGYACEALHALLRHAFTVLDQEVIAAVHDLPNSASRRIVERLGFRCLREVPGPKHPLRVYLLRRDEWYYRRARSATS